MDISVAPLPPLPSKYLTVAGEAFIYEDLSDPNVIIKVYHAGDNQTRSPKTGEDADRLLDLLMLANGVSPSQSLRLSTSFAWPQSLFGSSLSRIEGIAMKRASKDFVIRYSIVSGDIEKFQNLVFLGDALSQPIVTRTPYTSMDFETRVEIAFELLLSMRVVWEMGFRYCDYSENNILWSYEPTPKVFILDTESCRRPGVIGNKSNGWHPRTELGHSIEADRSQCGLAVWRIIVGDIGIAPPTMPGNSPGQSLRIGTKQLIQQLWEFGDHATYLDLVDDLRTYRGKKFIDQSFDEAVDSQFAQVVLDYAPYRPSREQSEILDRARQQRDLEQEILSLEPRLQRLRLNRAIPIPGFEFDFAPAAIQVPTHQDDELIRDLALNGDFEYIAEMFATLPDCIPINNVATRSIQSALANCGMVNLYSVPIEGMRQRFEWGWPGAFFSNCARIRIVNDAGDVLSEVVATRSKNKGGVSLPIDDTYPDKSRIEVSYGLVTQRGEMVFSPFGGSAEISVSPRQRSIPPQSPVRPTVELPSRPITPIPPRPSAMAQPLPPPSWSQAEPTSTTRTGPQVVVSGNFPPTRSTSGIAAKIKKFLFKVFIR
jgi:hypothetical protein